MVDLHSSRKAGSAQGPPSATERRECKSRVTLLLRDADSGQIDHMAAEPTHGPHHPCTSSSRLGARGTLLAIANVSLDGGSRDLPLGGGAVLQASKQALPHAPSRGLVARTDTLWNKLACPREPTGSLSEAIYSPHTQRLTAGPASRASGWPPNRGPKSLAQPERPAANPAGACDARRLRGGLLGTRR